MAYWDDFEWNLFKRARIGFAFQNDREIGSTWNSIELNISREEFQVGYIWFTDQLRYG